MFSEFGCFTFFGKLTISWGSSSSKSMSNVSLTISRMFGLVLTEKEEDNSSNKAIRILLAGPNSSGKTSFLFEYAVSCVEQGETVLFIAPKPITRLPYFVNGRNQPKSEILKLINFVYLASYSELLNFFSTVHLSKVRSSAYGRPKHVLIDEFDSYFPEKYSRTEETTRISRCLAYILDAVEYFSEIQSSDNVKTKCHLLVAETVLSDSLTIDRQRLYQHWITDFLRIRPTSSHVFEVQHVGCKSSHRDVLSDLVICYEICDKGIKLKELENH